MIGNRLLFLITGLAYGGAEAQLVSLATRLKARGWQVSVVSMLPPQSHTEDLQAVGIPVYSLGMRRGVPDPRALFRLACILKKESIQIVHSHMVHANLLARLVRLLCSVPVLISTSHSIDERGNRPSGRLRELAYHLTDPLCDITTQVSQAGFERYVKVKAVPPHKILYIPNGVETRRFRPNFEVRNHIRKELEVEGEFVWLAVGRFDPPKDYPTLLQAFAQVVQAHPNKMKLLIAGEGPLRPGMEALARELGLGKRVWFLGIRQDVPDLMNMADVYVMSSAWEGMPMVLLEASVSGLPIVATNVGGNREVIQNGKTGFLVPPKEPEAMSQAMLRIMNLPEEDRRLMGEASRQYVETNYSLDLIVDRWEGLYRELLERKGVGFKENSISKKFH